MASWRQRSSSLMEGEQKPLSLEDFRQYHESDKHWDARKQFLDRHLHLYTGSKLDQLIALSVVWSNIVFIGNRYGEQLTQKVFQMGEGIDIGEVPSYELVPGAKASKRPSTSEHDEQPLKKIGPRFGSRLRFEPMRFVASTTEEDSPVTETNNDLESLEQIPHDDIQASNSLSESYNTFVNAHNMYDNVTHEDSEFQDNPGYVYAPDDQNRGELSHAHAPDEQNRGEWSHAHAPDDQNRGEWRKFMTKMEQDYSAKFDSHCSAQSEDFRSNVLDTWTGVNKQGRKGIGFKKTPKSADGFPSRGVERGVDISCNSLSGRPANNLDKQAFINKLSAVIMRNISNSTMNTDTKRINYTFLLSHSIQECKTNPVYNYVPLKDIHPTDLPKNKKFPIDGYACEVRCQDIYLATGYSGSKNGARDRAAENAIKVLQQRLEVVTVNRKFGHTYREDLVVCPVDSSIMEFPPGLKHQDDSHGSDGTGSARQVSDPLKGSIMSKPWTEFILTENASDAICILNNSATFNKMVVDYQYDMMPNNTWRCRVFVQDHCISEGYGNKKISKHAAAEAAVEILKQMQPHMQKSSFSQYISRGPIKEMNDIVLYENSSNPVCTLNDTAQFNKITIEYVFERMNSIDWKCKVFMEQQFIAEAVGAKKTVKHEAAQAAVLVLKETQPVMVNNLKKGPIEDAISRRQICGLSSKEAYKQQIKEDNIGNQLLRKMGWTGGGLGREGAGIAEPISVKEQFSREGLGLGSNNAKINKRDIEQIIRNYAASYNQDDLTFAKELTNDERKHIHQVAQKYGLKSKSHGQGTERFLVVSRKRNKEDLINQLREEGQVGSYALVMPQQK
ncbi:NF-kappa-B-repressing factor [Bombina bombina]|uniref:NF-kappa-B-repressing factor n=1 Tax=Bombina bombina TaxID=8345 RepID=UPI00235AF7F1|nr:NF-kappa-B-repressing factor [Bombina bombina]